MKIKKTPKRRNHLATELRAGAYRPKVIPNKKKIVKPFKPGSKDSGYFLPSLLTNQNFDGSLLN